MFNANSKGLGIIFFFFLSSLKQTRTNQETRYHRTVNRHNYVNITFQKCKEDINQKLPAEEDKMKRNTLHLSYLSNYATQVNYYEGVKFR